LRFQNQRQVENLVAALIGVNIRFESRSIRADFRAIQAAIQTNRHGHERGRMIAVTS
jgi:hypothetical protein